MQSIDSGDGLAARLRHGSMILRAETLRIQFNQHARKFRPDQPRIPPGNPTGGEWTFDPRSRRAENERARLMPAFLPLLAVPTAEAALATIELALTLYAALSTFNTPDKRATLRFKAWLFEPDARKQLSVESLRTLDRGEAEKACPRLPLVQSMTDETTARLRVERPDLSPTQLGSLVHRDIDKQIKNLHDRAFKSEVSVGKSKQVDENRSKGYRIDSFELIDNSTVCVYDLKTGREGLYATRAAELAAATIRHFGTSITRIIVIEVRPGQ